MCNFSKNNAKNIVVEGEISFIFYIFYYYFKKYNIWYFDPLHLEDCVQCKSFEGSRDRNSKKGVGYISLSQKRSRFIKKLIEKKKIKVIDLEEIEAFDIFKLSKDILTLMTEKVYPYYKNSNKKIIEFIEKTLKTAEVETIYKRNLYEKIVNFNSINFILERIKNNYKLKSIRFYSNRNLFEYNKIKKLLNEIEQEDSIDNSVSFSRYFVFKNMIHVFFMNIKSLLYIKMKIVLWFFNKFTGKNKVKHCKRSYKYGIEVTSKYSKLTENNKWSDINLKSIGSENLIYLFFSKSDLKKNSLSEDVFLVPDIFYHSTDLRKWVNLFFISIFHMFGFEINESVNAVSHYFLWECVFKNISLTYYISGSDFNASHIVRNIALKQFEIDKIDSYIENMSGDK